MDFAETAKRGYIYKSSDPRDVEIKFIMSDVDIGSSGFSISGPTGKHSGSGCCSGFAYMFNIDDTSASPIPFRFRKEMWHVSYHTDPKTDTFTHPKFNFKLQNHGSSVGFAYVRYNRKDGVSPGHDSVVIEGWGNPDPDNDPENWILIKRTEDKGGWGDDGNKCPGGARDQIGTWGGPKFRMKSNGVGSITFKHVSLREIDPNQDFDSTPDAPEPNEPSSQPATTSRIKGNFTLMRDVNQAVNSICAPTGLSYFYNLLTSSVENKILGNHDAGGFVTIATERAGTAGTAASIITGKVIKQLDANLKKAGTPAGSISAKIWDSDGNIKYTSPTTFADGDLTTSFAIKSFDFTANTYTMQTGDRIGLEYTGTDNANYIICGIRRLDLIDSTNSYASQYDTVDGWRNLKSYDMEFKIWR